MKTHICEKDKSCSCGILDEEPDEYCPKHGGCFSIENYRCIHCGRFMSYKQDFQYIKDE